MDVAEEKLSEELIGELIALSRDWENEDSCRGYRTNGPADLEGRRVFCAREDGALAGYLFGRLETAERESTVLKKGERFFELEELYVVPERRSQGVGRALFRAAAETLRGETRMLLLSTATKDWRRILHFYIDELGMDFWSARLFKEITG